jgi:hypothetical protein
VWQLPGQKMGWLVAAIVGLITVVLIELFVLANHFKDEPGCPSSSVGSQAAAGASSVAIELTPQGGSDRLIVPFSADRRPEIRTLSFLPSSTLSVPAVQVTAAIETDLLREDNEKIFPADQLTFRSSITSNPDRLRITVCLDPRGPYAVPQGQYSGTILVGGPGIKPIPIAVTVSLAHTSRRLALLVAVIGALGGFGVKVLGDTTTDFWKSSRAYASTLVIGLLAAIATGYFVNYVGNPTFGEKVTDWIALFGVGFAAVVTGMTATDALGAAASSKAFKKMPTS